MKRIIAIVFWILVSGSVWAQSGSEPAPSGDKEKAPLDWLLIYYMSYDNNLEKCGPIILDGLEKGIVGPSVVVTVLADFTDREGLRRYVLRDDTRTEETLQTDNSASEEVLKEYVAWALKEFPSKRYGVVFLNHGGDLDDMSHDQWPGEGIGKQWLSARLVGPILTELRTSTKSESRFLFLQQCGRGSIQNLYGFRGAADAILCSQTTVGAPNTYYTSTVEWLCANPEASGVELSKRVMNDDEHYTDYVCVSGDALALLPGKLEPVVKALLPQDGKPLQFPTSLKPCFGGWAQEGETNYDLFAWLRAASDKGSKGVDDFEAWAGKDLILHHQFQSARKAKPLKWCGLSIFVPQSDELRRKYADYPLHQESLLGNLWSSESVPAK